MPTFTAEWMARIYYVYLLLCYTGITERSQWHLEILSHYNKISPLPRGHKATTNDIAEVITGCFADNLND